MVRTLASAILRGGIHAVDSLNRGALAGAGLHKGALYAAPLRQSALAVALLLLGALFSPKAYAQEELLRAPVWVYVEGVPGTATPENAEPLLTQLESLSRFVLAGMIYGWKYDYYPSDKTRGVAEEFTITPLGSIEPGDPSFTLTGLTAEYPRLSCWAQYVPNDETARWERHWSSVLYKTGTGRGSGQRTDGVGGIRSAYESALLNAVREHARKLEKNKPKEVTGEVRLRNGPRLFPEAGTFTAAIRVLITVDEVVPWRTF